MAKVGLFLVPGAVGLAAAQELVGTRWTVVSFV